jgi:hypothetical protein
MKRRPRRSSPVVRRNILLLLGILTAGCSGVSIDAARHLAVTGRETAVHAKQASIVSDTEYARALDGEAIQRGFSGSTGALPEIVQSFDAVRQELLGRALVFDRLADVYDAFGDLAGIDAATEVETALGNLGGAIAEYAKQMRVAAPVSADATNAIAAIGGLLADQIQRAKLKKASALIRAELARFAALLGDPVVRAQVTGFRQLLQADAATALILLWREGVLDAKPLLDDVGSVAGLAAARDAQQVVMREARVRDGLTLMLQQRLRRQIDLAGQSYDASVVAVNRLAAEHRKLEEEQALDLARLREVVAQLRTLVGLLTRVRAGIG